MAHNFVLLLIPLEVEKDVLDEYIRDLFLPFAREYDFPPLTYPCDCNGLEESIKFANPSTRHFHQYWRSYKMIPPADRPNWSEYIKDWETTLLSFRGDSSTSDPNCDRCKGSGYFCSTYYPWNMYDYWHGLKGDNLGSLAELKAEWKTYELPRVQPISIFQLIPPLQKPFTFYHVVTSDGLPYNRWDYSSEERWYEAWQVLAHNGKIPASFVAWFMIKLPVPASQHSMHPTGGSRRVFGQFPWLEVGSGKAALSHPAHPRVTHTVGRSNPEGSLVGPRVKLII